LVSEIPALEKYSFQVTTANTFPHSAGIASSASGISAFSLCMLTIISKINGKEIPMYEFYKIASFVSRMGSGSACRSIYGGFSVWGKTPGLHDSSDLYAFPINDLVHADLMKLRDAILVVSSSPKSISSSLGHELMKDHPFAGVRFDQAMINIREMLGALFSGDIEKIASISENEALTLHSLIMTSAGGSILLEPGSIEIIKKIQQTRQNGLPVFFSLDAGPNVHLLYPDKESHNIEKFIRDEVMEFCENGRVIFDHCGNGPLMRETESPHDL
jgi:diphosphomevalonate decarboxylase